jgi:SAM-dependent methyltransferase
MGYLLASPLRRWGMQSPETLLTPWIQPGFRVLEPGPGMGFFTLPMANMVGAGGAIVALDVQPEMLTGLRRKATRAQVADRLELRLVASNSLGIDDLAGTMDFVLAFAVVHEMPSAETFFREAAHAMKPGGFLYFAEPSGHVTEAAFQAEVDAACLAGLRLHAKPIVRRSRAVVLQKA